MKKISFFILFALLAASSVEAQKTATTKKLNWGFKTGINFSNLRVEDGANTDWKNGLAVGAFFRARTGKTLQIQPEVLYSSMGAKMNNGSLRLNYFSIPLLARYQCKKLAFLAGPQIDMLIQAKTKSSTNDFSKVTDNYNESSFNLTGGVEYWPWHCFGFSGRYIYGLSKVDMIGSAETKNQGFQLMAAVKL